MKNRKLCAAATALTLVTATVSLTAGAPEAKAARQQTTVTAGTDSAAALPAIALVAAGGLVGAFVLGVAQGYMEAKNAQQAGTTEPAQQEALANITTREFDYVLN
ncbi:MAG: hypothetical protein KC431_23760 [Myxococcales bacterium]|nr:hypothetical protein [Myxococcales bacterium]MCA9700564.1 hypothetical protein [Myxococcales bacterium]